MASALRKASQVTDKVGPSIGPLRLRTIHNRRQLKAGDFSIVLLRLMDHRPLSPRKRPEPRLSLTASHSPRVCRMASCSDRRPMRPSLRCNPQIHRRTTLSILDRLHRPLRACSKILTRLSKALLQAFSKISTRLSKALLRACSKISTRLSKALLRACSKISTRLSKALVRACSTISTGLSKAPLQACSKIPIHLSKDPATSSDSPPLLPLNHKRTTMQWSLARHQSLSQLVPSCHSTRSTRRLPRILIILWVEASLTRPQRLPPLHQPRR